MSSDHDGRGGLTHGAMSSQTVDGKADAQVDTKTTDDKAVEAQTGAFLLAASGLMTKQHGLNSTYHDIDRNLRCFTLLP
jgi:hypothetical protein